MVTFVREAVGGSEHKGGIKRCWLHVCLSLQSFTKSVYLGFAHFSVYVLYCSKEFKRKKVSSSRSQIITLAQSQIHKYRFRDSAQNYAIELVQWDSSCEHCNCSPNPMSTEQSPVLAAPQLLVQGFDHFSLNTMVRGEVSQISVHYATSSFYGSIYGLW